MLSFLFASMCVNVVAGFLWLWLSTVCDPSKTTFASSNDTQLFLTIWHQIIARWSQSRANWWKEFENLKKNFEMMTLVTFRVWDPDGHPWLYSDSFVERQTLLNRLKSKHAGLIWAATFLLVPLAMMLPMYWTDVTHNYWLIVVLVFLSFTALLSQNPISLHLDSCQTCTILAVEKVNLTVTTVVSLKKYIYS
jgi:hypothetical protein